MVEQSSAPTLAEPSYWDYGTPRPSRREHDVPAAHDRKRERPALWQGPRGFTLVSYETDFSRGGASRVSVRSPEGQDYCLEGVHLEIAEPERVVFTGSPEAAGDLIPDNAGTVTFRRA